MSIDTIIMCSCTALIILLSGVYEPGSELGGVALTQIAVADHAGDWGRYFVSIALLLFAFSSMIYNSFLGENSIEFFKKDAHLANNIFRVVVVALVFWASVQDLSTIFGFADLTMGLLAVANLAALGMLFKVARRLIADYDAQIATGVRHAKFEGSKLADLDLDRTAWPDKSGSGD